jgi:hypothetical protein
VFNCNDCQADLKDEIAITFDSEGTTVNETRRDMPVVGELTNEVAATLAAIQDQQAMAAGSKQAPKYEPYSMEWIKEKAPWGP